MAERPTSNRREFIQGRSAAGALVDLAERLLPDDGGDEPANESVGSSPLVRIGRRAMACEFEVLLPLGMYPQGTQTALEALDLVDDLENQMSAYRAESELSQINAAAAIEPVKVEPRLFELLEAAAQLHAETHGAYDVTTGPLSQAWGFYRRAGRVPGEKELADALKCVGSQQLVLDRARQTVKFARPGMAINLGSIGKGYALDRCAKLLAAAGIEHFLVHGGQSSVLARGNALTPALSHTGRGSSGGWWVGLRHPLRSDRRLAEIRLTSRALGTSGSGTQFFMDRGERFGHILDPRTGLPATGVISSTVVAATGAEADALSTALYVMGSEAAREFCSRHPEIAAVLILPAKDASSIEIWNSGFAEGDLRVRSTEY